MRRVIAGALIVVSLATGLVLIAGSLGMVEAGHGGGELLRVRDWSTQGHGGGELL